MNLFKKHNKTSSHQSQWRLIIASLLLPLIAFLILNLLYPLPIDKLTRDSSTAVYSKNGELLSLYLSDDDFWRIRTEIEDIPQFMQKALIEYEDKWFYYHPGVNPASLVRAFAANIKSGRKACGGSTLTMQVARMMEPKPRTYKSKLVEIFRAFQIESRYTKKEILAIYFNLAPYGGNIEGIGAASYFYFGKSSAVLSKSDSLALVGLPNSPNHLRPDLHYEQAVRHRDKIANLLNQKGLVSNEELADIIADTIPEKRFHAPSSAPHYSRLIKRKYRNDAKIKTTLDMPVQRTCEDLLSEHLSPLMKRGISNGAVVVIENKTRAVRAMVGSKDFYDSINCGQVNGAISPRSPGSALKPFVYALAFNEGLISPRTMLSDVPINYSGYTPSNYSDNHLGSVSAEDALKFSLNIPVINLHSKLENRFYNLLKSGGITTLTKPYEHYGLPLALGAGEVTLLELTNLYSTLASDGSYQPYRLTESQTDGNSKQLFSDATSYIITEILADIRRPDLPDCWESSVNRPKIAWKTGTSYGNRDAWSIGYNSEYTIGVWIGNFSARESDNLVGAEVAAPLLFDIFNSLNVSSSWFAKPESIGTRKVCSVSGMPVNGYCPHSVTEMYIPGISPSVKCNMHKRFYIDDETGMRLTVANRHEHKHTQKVYEILPQKIASWRKRMGYPVDEIPALLQDSSFHSSESNPVILSPQNTSSFVLQKYVPVEHQRILLKASVSNTIKQLFWFVDGELLTKCAPHDDQFYYPTLGNHKIACMDNEGNSSTVQISIN